MQRWIAESRVELEQARLLAYRCAWRLDQAGHHGAWRDVSLIKVAVPAMLQRIADRAMQVFGAMGGSDDTPIHQALAWGRLLRIGDGPDEVHLRQIFQDGSDAVVDNRELAVSGGAAGVIYRHARPCAGHPRPDDAAARTTWMAGSSPAMTTKRILKRGSTIT